MPDLDQTLVTLINDVSARTRAPGASAAIKQAHRRRAQLAAAAVATVSVVAVGAGMTAGTLGGSDDPSPIGEPATPVPTSAPESAEPTGLSEIVGRVPGWDLAREAVRVRDSASSGPCAGDWTMGAREEVPRAAPSIDSRRRPKLPTRPTASSRTLSPAQPLNGRLSRSRRPVPCWPPRPMAWPGFSRTATMSTSSS